MNFLMKICYIKTGARSKEEPEYEILDTGVFDNDEYFDVKVTYAKQNPQDIFIKIDITNRNKKEAPITLLPTLWFYNRWVYTPDEPKPSIKMVDKIQYVPGTA